MVVRVVGGSGPGGRGWSEWSARVVVCGRVWSYVVVDGPGGILVHGPCVAASYLINFLTAIDLIDEQEGRFTPRTLSVSRIYGVRAQKNECIAPSRAPPPCVRSPLPST